MDISSNPVGAASIQPLEGSKPIEAIKPQSMQINEIDPDSKVDTPRLTLQLKVDVAHTIMDMKEPYSRVQEELQLTSPELAEKDWDFTVDESGELVILEGSDKLSDEDISTLTRVLEDNGIDEQMNQLADEVVKWGEGLRGPDQQSRENIGKHDITRENFSEIIKGRDLITSSKMRVESGLNYYEGKAVQEYNSNKQGPLEALSMQIQDRAIVKYEMK